MAAVPPAQAAVSTADGVAYLFSGVSVLNNKALWESVFVTDPKAVKPITGKDYGGNSPKPYWIVERLTDVFGPCGIGWGYIIKDERFHAFAESNVLHVARVELWSEYEGKRGSVEQMGQTKAAYVTSRGQFKLDEDAPKKSVTDALVKCASYLGFAGDIFSGRWDDSKYVASAAKEWEGKAPSVTPTSGAEDLIEPARAAELQDLVVDYVAAWDDGKTMKVIKHFYSLTNDEQVYVTKLLQPRSDIRRDIKANSPHKEAA